MAENGGQAKDAQRQMIVSRNMGKNMHRLRNAEKSFSDVIIQTRDGKQLPVHKAVLVSASDYFATMFSTEVSRNQFHIGFLEPPARRTVKLWKNVCKAVGRIQDFSKMQERYSDVVEMNNMASDVLETVINFLYDQPIFFSEETIYELTDAAEHLLVTDLKTECQKFLLVSTKPSNCLKHRLCGKRYNMKAVTEKADGVIAANFENISEEKDFNTLECDDLQMILQKRRRKRMEEFVFLAIVKWVKHDMDGRQKHFGSLFLFIDTSRLTERFIETKVLSEILVNKTNSSLLRVSKELMNRIKLKTSHVSWRIGIIGGQRTKSDVAVFDPDVNEIQHLAQLDFGLSHPVSVKTGDDVYFIDQFTSKVISLNLRDQEFKWEEFTTMPQPKRSGLGCSVLNGFIYVAGGGSESTNCFSSVIKYDLSNNIWSDVKSMNKRRMWLALISLEGKLYAIAGYNGQYLGTVEMYDADKNEWTYVSSLNKERSQLAATAFNGKIYATGGYNGLSSVEMYDPIEDVWMMMKELNVPRRLHGSCVVDGKLYVVGGVGIKSIEVYDPDKNEWKISGQLDKKRTFSAVCAM